MSDTTDEEYGNNDDETAFAGPRRMKIIHFSKRKLDKNSTCRENLDGFLPVHTSHWNLPCLESLRIFYSEKPLPLSELLDIVYKNTSMFEPLTLNQTKVVNYLQNSLDFCTSIGDVMIYSRRYPREIGRDLLEEIKKNLEKDIFKNKSFVSDVVKVSTIGQIENFIKSTVFMMYFMRNEREPSDIPENVFEDLFNKFLLMCDLVPSSSLWQVKAKLLQQHVQSETDLVILPSDPTQSGAVTALSIVKVTNLADYLHSPPSSSADDRVKPEIYNKISEKVLGQHGGELTVHNGIFNKNFENKKDKKAYFPGMIVVGTEVTLTLLVISYEHFAELFEKKVVEKSESYIYYSETKDMLKKEERDQLLEAFGRLQNTACQT